MTDAWAPTDAGQCEGPCFAGTWGKCGFDRSLRGYTRIRRVADLQPGGWVRYAIVTPSGVLYRKGGVVTYVDPQRRYFRLRNVCAGITWSVQIIRAAGESLRVWYMPAPLRSRDIVVERVQ